MRIQELMSKPAVTCQASDTLSQAAQLMWEYDCGALPVVDGSGSIVGVITDRDICMAGCMTGSPLHAIPVSNAMAKQVFSCHADDSLEQAERLMSNKQVRRIPVVDGNNHPVGMLSLNDVARYAATTGKKDGVERELMQTLAAICQPREQQASQRTQQQQQQPRAGR